MRDRSRGRILIFLNAFWNNGRGMSGGDQILVQVFRRISDRFDRIAIVTNHDGHEKLERVTGAEFLLTPARWERWPLILNYTARLLDAVRRTYRMRAFTHVYGGSDFLPDVVPALLYKLRHPEVRWFQAVYHLYPSWRTRPGSRVRNAIAQYAQRWSLALIRWRADVVICLNHGVRDALIQRGFPREGVIVNAPGIDLRYLERISPAPSTPYDATFLGRMNPSKGIFDLVEIWAHVVRRLPDATLAIIGGGDPGVAARLRDAIHRRGLGDRITMLGYLEDDAAFAVMKRSRTFLFPSHEEGFGIAVAEALACGVPAVSWDLPVYREVFGSATIQVTEGDCGAFAAEVVRLLADESHRQSLATTGGAFVRRYDWDEIAERHAQILLGGWSEQYA